jgi:hypothetical protein
LARRGKFMQSVSNSARDISAEGPIPQVVEGHPKRRSDVRVRVIDGETVVLDRKRAKVHQLNRTASYIWSRCDGKATVQEIVRQLAESFDVDLKTAMRDVMAAVWQLRKLNLLEPSDESAVLS